MTAIFICGRVLRQWFLSDRPEKFASPASSVYLRSIRVNDKPLPLATGANNLQTVSLKYFQNKITIETGVIDYYSKGKNQIRYKLEGVNNAWQYAPAYYTIRFDGLRLQIINSSSRHQTLQMNSMGLKKY
jgi:hypothetical protein